jgi:hypothetical protein
MSGFYSKRDAAADKLQDGKCKLCVDGCIACDARAQPVQEPAFKWRSVFQEMPTENSHILLCFGVHIVEGSFATNGWASFAYGTAQPDFWAYFPPPPHHKRNQELYTAPLPAQPEQEPVGTLNISRYKGHLVNHDFDYFGELPDGAYSVYTAPPQRPWVGLTDEEIHGTAGYNGPREMYLFALAIQAKLKERNS